MVNTCPCVPVALYISLSSPVKRSLAIVDEASIESPVALRYEVVALVNDAFVANKSDEVLLVVDALVAAKSVEVALTNVEDEAVREVIVVVAKTVVPRTVNAPELVVEDRSDRNGSLFYRNLY